MTREPEPTTRAAPPAPVWRVFYKDAWVPFHKDARETWEEFEKRCQVDHARAQEYASRGGWVWEPER